MAVSNDQAGVYMKRVMWARVSTWGHVCRGNGMCAEFGYMGTSGNRDSQLASRSALKDFTDDALSISAGS